ncbi:hypothetical protein WIMU106979_24885 [Williamsia muralis]
MPIDFDLSEQQKKLKYQACEFATDVLRPVAEYADALSDPQEAFAAMRPVYEVAAELGFTTMFLPREYGGGGASNVDFLVAIEELCAVDPGFPTILLVNGLALMPILWLGSDEQREKWLGRATSDTDGSFLAGWVVSERGGTANFDHPNPTAGRSRRAGRCDAWRPAEVARRALRDSRGVAAAIPQRSRPPSGSCGSRCACAGCAGRRTPRRLGRDQEGPAPALDVGVQG